MAFRQGTAENGKILREDIDQPAVDGAAAGHDAVTGDLLFGHAEFGAVMLHIHVELFEAAGIQQDIQPLARRQPALLVLGLDALFPTTHAGGGAAAFQFFQLLQHGCALPWCLP